MAKKKSKTQKQRKNLKKKRKIAAQVKGQVTTKKDVLYNVALTNPDIFKDISKKANQENNNTLNKPKKIDKKNNDSFRFKDNKKKNVSNEKTKKNVNISKKTDKIINKKENIQSDAKIDKNVNIQFDTKIGKNVTNKVDNKELKKVDTKEDKKIENVSISTKVNNVVSIIFNAILVLSFIILLIGCIRVDVFSKKEIIIGSVLTIFLMLIALSYNKYISGKIFTIILVTVMAFATYKLQYTYDFIHNLNSAKYEYKTYYLVGFDTPMNVNVYSVGDRNVGLLVDNNINVQRKLNTIVNRVNYIIYDNEDLLFNSLYNSDVRALLLTENQYKYLQIDSKFHSEKKLKVLYEFKVNAPK